MSEETEQPEAAAPSIDAEKAELTFAGLVELDHKLRDQGCSVADLLTILAHTSQGIRV